MDILDRKGIPLRKEKQKGNQAPLYDTLNNSNRQIKLTFPRPDRPYQESGFLSPLKKKKHSAILCKVLLPTFVGMTRFELATPRPPDAYSNRTELHPEQRLQR